MIKSSKDLVGEIDQTIDQLIENAKVLNMISSETFYEEEMLALAKTQESLIAHLIHMDEQILHLLNLLFLFFLIHYKYLYLAQYKCNQAL